MSKEIDQKIVEMRFDNQQFERNVQTSLSTLDKLKQKLNFKNVDKSFEGITEASKKVDMSKLGDSVDKIGLKFDGMYTIADQALRNITNSAMNAAKNLTKSLSLDQITAGMTKYEQKTASVQTIMNATGKSINEVNKYLEKLMWFSDETSYGFTDMTSALATLTSSGGDIEKLIPLITGVANATAFAGKGAAEFSRVLQFGINQAYSLGYMQVADWKSIEGATVNSKQLVQTLITAGEELGKIKKGSVTLETFRNSLKDKWLDKDVMELGFGRFGEFSDAVYKLVNGDISEFSKEVQDLYNAGKIETAADAIDVLSKHYSELGVKAFKSAQEAKTFTEAIDATKDAVSSGWMKTFELIFGNYEQAKELWTDLANTLWDVFASGGESRNEWLKKVMNYSPLEQFAKKIQKITDTIQAPVKKLQEYNDIVNRIIRGDFGNGAIRFQKLADAGYDWAYAQNLVNEKLGNSFRYATDFNDAQKNLTKQTIELTDAKLKEIGLTKDEIKMYRELEAESKKTGKSIDELIASMNEADGRTLLIGSFKNIGSALIGVINAIKEAFSEIFPPLTVLQTYNLIAGLNKLTEKLRLTDKTTGELNKTGDKIKRTFKGVFAIFKIFSTIVGGPVKLALKAVGSVMKAFGVTALDITANVGDAIVAFSDWLDSIVDWEKVFKSIGKVIQPVIDKVKEWVDSFKSLPIVEDSINKLKKAFSGGFGTNAVIKTFEVLWNILKAIGKGIKDCYDAFMSLPGVQNGINKLKNVLGSVFSAIGNGLRGIDFNSIANGISKMFAVVKEFIQSFSGDSEGNGEHLISGLGNAIKNGVSTVVGAITEICKAIYTTFTNFFDINSPSKVFFTLGKFCMAGLVAGLLFAKNDTQSAMTAIGGSMLDGLTKAASLIAEAVKKIDVKDVFAIGVTAAMFTTINKTIAVMDKFAGAAKDFGAASVGVGNFMNALANKINPKKTKFTQISDNVLKLAGAIAIMAGAVYLLSLPDYGKVWSAVGAIAVLAIVIGGLTFAISKMDGAVDSNYGKTALALIGMTTSLYIMAMAIKKLDFINDTNVDAIMTTMTGMLFGLAAILVICGTLIKGKTAQNIDKVGFMILKISSALMLMTLTMKLMSTLDRDALITGGNAILAFTGIVAALTLISVLAGKRINKIGATLLKISAAMMLMIVVIKMISGLDRAAINKGLGCIISFGLVIAGLLLATRLAGGKSLEKVGGTLIAMAGAMLIMSLIVKLLATCDKAVFEKGLSCIVLLGFVIAALVAATRLAGGNSLKGVSVTLFSMSICIGMLAAMSILCSLIPVEGLAKGVAAISMLGVIVALMIHATKGAEKVSLEIKAMSMAIGIMAASVLVLSFIPLDRLAAATGAMSILMGMFALIIKASGSAKGSIGTLITMTVAVGLLAGIVYLLAKVPVEPALTSVAALSMLLLVMSGSLLILSKLNATIKDSLSGILALTLMAVPLLAFVGVLYAMQNIDGAIKNAIALAGLATVMTLLLPSLMFVGGIVSGSGGLALLGIGALALMAIPLMVFVGVLAMMQNIKNAIKNATALSELMLVLTACLTVLSIVGPAALIGVSALTSVSVFLVAMGVVVTAIGALMEKFPALEKFMDKGIDILVKLAGGIGKVIGSFVSNFATSALSGLPQIGLLLSQFMMNLNPFLMMSKMFTEENVSGIKALVKAMLLLSGANLVEGITSFITGESSIDTFAKQLPKLGKGLAGFIKEIGDFDDTTVTSVNCAAKALKAIAEAAAALPNEGGILAAFIGDNSIGLFDKETMEGLGDGIAGFANKLGTFDDAAVTKVQNGTNALKAIAEAASEIPNAGGFLADWVGDNNDFEGFSDAMPLLGKGISGFASSIGTFTDDQKDAVECGAEAIATIAKAASEIPNAGGYLATWLGDNDLSKFAEQLPTLGEAIQKFGNNAGKTKKDKVEKAVSMLKAFTDLGKTDIYSFTANIKSFGDSINTFAADVADFTAAASEISSGDINSAVVKIKSVLTSLNDLQSADAAPVKELSKALSDLALNGVREFINSLTSDATKQGVKTALDTMVSNARDSAKSETNYKKFKKLGKYLVDGFVAGIDANKYKATDAGKDLAKAAYKAAKEELEVNSPSKKFIPLGGSTVEGFAKGVKALTGDAEGAMIGMGSAALKAFEEFFDINSPSLVMNAEGHYIVQGVAEGIKADMSAEEAMKQKAQNIADAFQNEMDKYDLYARINENELELWKRGAGKNASAEAVDAKTIEYLNRILDNNIHNQGLAYDKWSENVKYFGENSKEAKEAWNDYYEAQLTVIGTQEEIQKVHDDAHNRLMENLARGKDNRDKARELWLLGEGKYASDEEIYKRYKNDYALDLSTIDNELTALNNKHKEAIETYGGQSEQAYQAWLAVYEKEVEKSNLLNDMADLEQSALQNIIDSANARMSSRDLDQEYWDLKNEHKVISDATRDARETAKLQKDLVDQMAIVDAERQKFLDVVAQGYDKSNDAYIQAEESWKQARNKEQSIRNDIAQITIDAAEREREKLETQYKLASDNADLQYQIWEKTVGRKATSTEKDVAKVAMMSKQLLSQTQLLEIARQEWVKAQNKYGKASNEANQAYSDYLQKQLDIANLQNEITDINEKAVTKQKLAQSNYTDYMKKYKKYYLENGMTEEDLERDAKLVSGYDPANTLNNVLNKATDAFNDLQTNPKYQNILTSFNDMGTSYVSAISDGVQQETFNLTETVITLAEQCATSIKSKTEQWKEAGACLVDGFMSGIKSKIEEAVSVALALGNAVSDAIRNGSGGYTVSAVYTPSASGVGTSSFKAATTENFASQTSALMSRGRAFGQYTTNNNTNNKTVNYVQNNYSPKSLTATEIYRQTNNQLSGVKEALS